MTIRSAYKEVADPALAVERDVLSFELNYPDTLRVAEMSVSPSIGNEPRDLAT